MNSHGCVCGDENDGRGGAGQGELPPSARNASAPSVPSSPPVVTGRLRDGDRISVGPLDVIRAGDALVIALSGRGVVSVEFDPDRPWGFGATPAGDALPTFTPAGPPAPTPLVSIGQGEFRKDYP